MEAYSEFQSWLSVTTHTRIPNIHDDPLWQKGLNTLYSAFYGTSTQYFLDDISSSNTVLYFWKETDRSSCLHVDHAPFHIEIRDKYYYIYLPELFNNEGGYMRYPRNWGSSTNLAYYPVSEFKNLHAIRELNLTVPHTKFLQWLVLMHDVGYIEKYPILNLYYTYYKEGTLAFNVQGSTEQALRYETPVGPYIVLLHSVEYYTFPETKTYIPTDISCLLKKDTEHSLEKYKNAKKEYTTSLGNEFKVWLFSKKETLGMEDLCHDLLQDSIVLSDSTTANHIVFRYRSNGEYKSLVVDVTDTSYTFYSKTYSR